MKKYLTLRNISAAGILVSITTIVYALTVANPPQCDTAAVVPKVDNCVIGANIGLGLLLLIGYFLFLVSIVSIACTCIVANRKKIPFLDRHIYISLASVIVVVGFATIVVITFANNVLSHLIKS